MSKEREQPKDQKAVMDWETPSLTEIPVISKQHVAGLEVTAADEAWQLAGMHHVVIYTKGRKTGKEHNVALPIWFDADGRRIVVASYAGAENNPSWFVNLSDTEANPEVKVRSQEGMYWSKPEILDGEDYDRNWAALTADREWYRDYQVKAGDRRIPLVRLPETRPYE